MHLYEKGQSQIGAAFRVPFSSLLTAQCQPLIEKSVDRSVSEDQAYQNGRVDLYMPAPATATSRAQVLQYHVATRNFFAWVFRRSLVGDQLGGAVIALIHSMEEFREAGDHVQDVLEYLDEEGYLDMRNQPQHALAMLHLAEVFEMRELYIDAFAHCVGMSESMYKHPEYSVSLQNCACLPMTVFLALSRQHGTDVYPSASTLHRESLCAVRGWTWTSDSAVRVRC